MKILTIIILLFSFSAFAEEQPERVGKNDRGGTITLTNNPCTLELKDKDIMKQAVSTIIIDGELRPVYGCYSESIPPNDVEEVAAASMDSSKSKMAIRVFGMVNIMDANGAVYASPSTDFVNQDAIETATTLPE